MNLTTAQCRLLWGWNTFCQTLPFETKAVVSVKHWLSIERNKRRDDQQQQNQVLRRMLSGLLLSSQWAGFSQLWPHRALYKNTRDASLQWSICHLCLTSAYLSFPKPFWDHNRPLSPLQTALRHTCNIFHLFYQKKNNPLTTSFHSHSKKENTKLKKFR